MEESRKRRGGARPGAGRPKTDGRMCSFRLSGDMATQLERKENKAGFIRDCIARALEEERRRGNPLPEAAAGPDSALGGSAVPGMVAGPDSALDGSAVPVTRVRPAVLPYFDVKVVAGFPVPLDNDEKSQDIDILRLLCPHPEASYLIRVNGDSMIDAGVCSGDIVIVDKSRRDPSPKEIAVCELNGEYTLKRFVEEDGEGWLVPANPAYPRFRVTEDDDFSIWGTVTYIIHKARD